VPRRHDDAGTERNYRWGLLCCLALGFLYAVIVPLGQPYDEPAHLGNVEFYAREWRLPEVGEPGSTYQSQMGPGYYAPAGLLYSVADRLGGDAGPYAVRLAGVLMIWPAMSLTRRLVRSALPGREDVAVATALVFGASSPILAVASSSQNDYLAIVLTLAAFAGAARELDRRRWSPSSGVTIGVLCALAFLTKAHTAFAGPAIVLVVAIIGRRSALRYAAALIGAFVALSGWWVLRNIALYGDLTGRSSMATIGLSFPPRQFTGAGSILRWFRSDFAYFVSPGEYYRNEIRLPTSLTALVVLTAATGVFGLIVAVRRAGLSGVAGAFRHPPAILLVTGWTMLYVGYAVTTWTSSGLSGRHLYPLAVVPFATLAVGLAEIGRTAMHRRLVVALTLGTLASVNVWALIGALGLPDGQYI
jgi:Dolichyl-phosphate-mannose-protein mannosyltransferase